MGGGGLLSSRRAAQEAEVVACGSSGLATDGGADSGAVLAWGNGRRAAELRG